ncbi:MAG: PqqD family protein [Candidatus Latescibacteria bacterium]|nr:PqqD family protein [Candidatus Latescibacterota bacterium]
MNQAELNITDLRDRSFAAAGDQVSNVLGDEKIILDMKSGEYFGMNPVGADIWDYIQQPRKLDEIVAILMDKYGIDQERCETDVLALLAELSDVGLIEIT